LASLLPASKTTVKISTITDDYGTNKSDIATGGLTDDTTPTIKGTLSAKLATGEKVLVQVSGGPVPIFGYATTTGTGTTWSYEPTLAKGTNVKYSVTARIDKLLASPGPASAPFTFTLNTENVPPVDPPAPPTTFTTNAKSQTKLTDLWNTGGKTSFNLNKFIGIADKGPGIYDTGIGGVNPPKAFVLSKEFYKDASLKLFGVGYSAGAGAGIKASAKAGLDVNINASLGSADLNLDNSITWQWTKTGDNFFLSSSYANNASTLQVTGPSLQLGLKAAADVNLDAYIKYKSPLDKSATTVPLVKYAYNKELFNYNFDSKTPQSISLFGDAATISYYGLNLDTTNNSQVTNGVKSSVDSKVLGVNLDIDNIIGKFYGLPSGLSVDYSKSFGPLSASVKGTLANLGLGANLSIAQDITAKVDSITGKLKFEDGTSVDYKVGDKLTLSAAQYDKNKDGKLGLDFNFTKNGTLANKTSVILKTNIDYELLDGSVTAKAGVKVFGKEYNVVDKSWNMGPAYVGDLPLTSTPLTVFDKSWAMALGTGSNELVLA